MPAPTTRSRRPSTRKAATAGPSFDDASDWSPGAPLLYAASFYATGGAREGTARIVELLLGLAAIVVVYLLGRRLNCRPAGLIAALRRRRLPALHPLHRSPLQRATGHLHAAGGGPRLPLGRGRKRPSRGWRGVGCPAGAASSFAPLTISDGRFPPRRKTQRPAGHPTPRQDPRAEMAGPWFFVRPDRPDPPGVPPGRDRFRRSGGDPNRSRTWLEAGPCRSRPVRRRAARPDRPLDRSTTRWSSIAPCRSRPAAARRSTSAPSCRPTANTSGSRRGWCERYLHRDLEPGSEALERVDPTPLFDRVAARYPDLPRDRRWARSASRTSPSTSAKTRSATWR